MNMQGLHMVPVVHRIMSLLNPLKHVQYLMQIKYKNSISTLQKGHAVFIIKPKHFMLFREKSCCLLSESQETKTSVSVKTMSILEC